jgi:DNA-binding XRE family transcriptional regulator
MRIVQMEDAEMLADVKAYDAVKARLEDGEDELIPLEITERKLRGEAALRIWREHRKLTQERLAKKAKVSRALIAAIETKRKTGPSVPGRSWALRSMWDGSNWPEANRFRFFSGCTR